MTPLVLDHPAGVEAPADPLAAFLADVANFGRIVVRVEAMEGDPDDLWTLAGDAEAAGLVDRWPDAKEGPSVVLSALSVARLGLRPTIDGDRWLRPGEREAVRRPFYTLTDDQAEGIDHALANAADPDALPALDQLVAVEDGRRQQIWAFEALERLAAWGRTGRPGCPAGPRLGMAGFLAKCETGDHPELEIDAIYRQANRDPSMVYFEGMGPAWPIAPTAAGRCGACRGGALAYRTYCLWCDRSGADSVLFPPREPKPVPRPKAEAGPTVEPPRPVVVEVPAKPAGGTGRAGGLPRERAAAWDRTMAQLEAMRAERLARRKRAAG